MENMPQIDVQKCDGCGLCVGVCQCQIIVIVENKATIKPKEKCEGCHNWCTECEFVCPVGAISCPFDIVIEKTRVDKG